MSSGGSAAHEDGGGVESESDGSSAGGLATVVPWPVRTVWWQVAAVVVVIVGVAGCFFVLPRSMSESGVASGGSTSSSVGSHGAGSMGRSTVRGGGDVNLIAMTSEQRSAARKAFSGATDYSNLDVPVSQCLSAINMAHSPILGAAPVGVPASSVAGGANSSAPAASRGTGSQLFVLGAPLRIVVVEKSCSRGESSVLFRSELGRGSPHAE